MQDKVGRGRKQLVLLMALFLAPVIIAIIMYNNLSKHGPAKTKNYGDLVVPARPLSDTKLQSVSGKVYKFSDMKGKWIMVYIGTAECDKTCSDVLFKMRQSRLYQQGEHKRIDRLYISVDGKPADSLQAALKEHAGLEVVYGKPDEIDLVVKQFELKNKAPAKSAQRLYIVDPLGNLMMSYEKDFDAVGLIKDMTLLLKVSHIG